ncbi:MAG: hypothetical protein HY331_15400 [Chloroflexi bacterium]|nr:hypothetical protein [Chloroflexota bacterium]
MTTARLTASGRKPAADEYGALAESFRRSLLAENKTPSTIKTYLEAVDQFAHFLRAQGMPRQV